MQEDIEAVQCARPRMSGTRPAGDALRGTYVVQYDATAMRRRAVSLALRSALKRVSGA